MAQCDACGNDYARSFDVSAADGKRYTFDSFECAIHTLAPACANCGVKVIGHGVEQGAQIFCCHHCQEQAGAAS